MPIPDHRRTGGLGGPPRLVLAGALLIIFSIPACGWSITPMDYFNSLVAGGVEAGFQDGPFYQARFNQPVGLALDDGGGRLFVADRDNNRIRVVYLNDNNRVETLAGSGQAGKADGPLAQASFDHPTLLTWVPPDHLAVYDQGNPCLRWVDLGQKAVSTLAKSPDGKNPLQLGGNPWNMVYRLQDNSLYFTLPSLGELDRLDLKSPEITKVIAQNPLLPQPQALCASDKGLFVADQGLTSVYRVDLTPATGKTRSLASLSRVGTASRVQALAETDDALYALQSGPCALVQVSDEPQTVSLASPWGFSLSNDNPNISEPLLFSNGIDPVGMVSSPKEPRKFYISHPRPGAESIVSVKDYHFDANRLARSVNINDNNLKSVTDYTYPAAKPPGTFRILMIGTSRIVCGDTPGLTPGGVGPEETALRSFTLPKILELLLNTQASLQGVPTHYEVMTFGQPGGLPHIYAHYYAPELAQKYGVDLVLLMETSFDVGYVQEYFDRPLTSEGVPARDMDPEFSLKHYPARIPQGTVRHFYENCEKNKMITKISPTDWAFPYAVDVFQAGDAGMAADAMEMMSKPLQLLSNKLKNVKGGDGKSPPVVLFFTPAGRNKLGVYENFWKQVAEKSQVPFLDMTDGYTALGESYEPELDAADTSAHYTAYGNFLMAQLLEHYLTAQKWIPFEASNGQ